MTPIHSYRSYRLVDAKYKPFPYYTNRGRRKWPELREFLKLDRIGSELNIGARMTDLDLEEKLMDALIWEIYD